MSQICDICGRGPIRTTSRSHSNIASKRWQKINVQAKKIDGKSVLICTKCLKTRSKKKK